MGMGRRLPPKGHPPSSPSPAAALCVSSCRVHKHRLLIRLQQLPKTSHHARQACKRRPWPLQQVRALHASRLLLQASTTDKPWSGHNGTACKPELVSLKAKALLALPELEALPLCQFFHFLLDSCGHKAKL